MLTCAANGFIYLCLFVTYCAKVCKNYCILCFQCTFELDRSSESVGFVSTQLLILAANQKMQYIVVPGVLKYHCSLSLQLSLKRKYPSQLSS